MKKQTIFRILLVPIMVFMTLAAASPASAGESPTHVVFDIDMNMEFSIPVGDDQNPCDFPLNVTSVGFIRVNVKLDASGRPVFEVDIYGTTKRWLSGVNDNKVNVQLYGPATYDFAYDGNILTLTVTGVGATQIFTIPGYGKIRGGGQFEQWVHVFDITDWENWVWLDSYLVKTVGNTDWGGAEEFCQYLGGNVY